MHERIIILDFGSQYTQLIARRIRESGVYSEIYPCTESLDAILAMKPKGIILSGSPYSVYDTDAPLFADELLHASREDGSQLPILGICYGLQAMAYKLGGKVVNAQAKEYGRAEIIIDDPSDLLNGIPSGSTVWMSHGDHLASLPD
nr:gamma-glutamyl-gamma-aminobutyrate hydrolase family protein [Rhodothermaceae bacterium]